MFVDRFNERPQAGLRHAAPGLDQRSACRGDRITGLWFFVPL
jgi:hypothetical protein